MVTTLDGETLTRAGILRELVKFNAAAKVYSRRGKIGTLTEGYRDCHDSINDALTALGY